MHPKVYRHLKKRLTRARQANPASPADITNYLFAAARHLSPTPTRGEMDQFVASESLPPYQGPDPYP